MVETKSRQAGRGVPLLDLQEQYAPLREAILEAMTRVCDSQRFILGPEVAALEEQLAALLGTAGLSAGRLSS